jgi:hypothetical protein
MSGLPRAGRVEVDEHLNVATAPTDLARGQGNNTWLDIVARSKWGRGPGDAAPHVHAEHPAPVAPRSASAPAPFVAKENTLRDRLADLLKAERQTVAALDYANEAHDRAMRHRGLMQSRYADFISLDAEIAAATAATLRDGAAMPDYSGRKLARSEAQSALEAATTAEALLLTERSEAAGAASSARHETDQCIAQVLALVGERIAIEHKAKLAEAEQLLLRLRAMAQSVTGVSFGEVTRSTLFEDERTAGFHRSTDPLWQTWAAALRTDPQASLTPD